MKEWCLEHPYLTAIIALTALSTVADVIKGFIDLFRKPQPPAPPPAEKKIEELPPEDKIEAPDPDPPKADTSTLN